MTYIIPDYLDINEAIKIIPMSKSTMYRYFKEIQKQNPHSVKVRAGLVNRRDFNNFFNIQGSYRKGETK